MAGQAMQSDEWLDEARRLLTVWGDWLKGTPGVIPRGRSYDYAPRVDNDQAESGRNEEAEAVDVVLCWVRSQSPKVFRVLYRFYYEDASAPEIGDDLRVSAKTARNWKVLGETMVWTRYCSEQKIA